MQHYFPGLDSKPRKGSQWYVLHQRPSYIWEYHRHLRSLDEDTRDALHAALGELFASVQCLPFSLLPEGSRYGWIWKKEEDTIVIVTNPVYYRLMSVGARRTGRATRGPRTTVNQKTYLGRILKNTLGTEAETAAARSTAQQQARLRARKANEKRSAKARNRRVPPQNSKSRKRTHDEMLDDDDDYGML